MRQSWDEYFFQIAQVVAGRGSCDRLRVGCVLVGDKRIIATGYNGSIPGAPHCDDVGHQLLNGHCVRTIHAEINAIANAAKMGVSTRGTTAYVTHTPCYSCFKALVSAGVKEIRALMEYENAYTTYPSSVQQDIDNNGIKVPKELYNKLKELGG